MIKILKERIVVIIFSFIFLGLFPLTLFRMIAFPKANAELKEGIKQNLEAVLNRQKDLITLLWDERKSHARSIADTIHSALFIHNGDDFVSLLSGKDEHEYLRLKTQLECIKADYGYKGIFVCDSAGVIRATTENENSWLGLNIPKEKSFHAIQETLHDGKPYFSNVIHYSLSNKAGTEDSIENEYPSLFMSYPVKGKKHDVAGAVLLWMDASMLNDGMRSVGIGKTGETYLVNKDGIMITQSRFSGHIKNNSYSCRTCHKVVVPDTKTLTTSVEKCITNRTDGYNLEGYSDYDGIKVVGAWTWLKDLNAGLIVEIDADEAFGTVNNINSLVKSLMLVMIIPAFAVAALTSRKLSSGSALKDLPLPQKTLLGLALVFTVGFIIAIMDGYELKREHGYLREQKYKIHNPLNVFGSIMTKRDEDFIKSNIYKFKEQYSVLKSENTIKNKQKETEDKELVKNTVKQSLEKTVATWELKP
ncbi:MAG: cache domain-containing protein [Candidatus Loosdrechtia sp.]|uniref:cache domain-containing protein n=1 Tax=Candidatus Loosdrechtia sp. TaxID=3101272 RepID=UPI003A61AE73|nr:MAG: cache domain-containing protein [Candidatus Jettenia sp. AMX2]